MAHDDDMMTPDDHASDELVPMWTTDGHLDEGTIHTWIDGAFDDAQSAIVTAHVDGCAVCRESVAEARGFVAGASRMVRALDAVPVDVVPMADVERVASRIVAAAAADVTRTTGGVSRARRAWYAQPAMRAAAAILVMVAGGSYVWSRTTLTPTKESRVESATSDAPAAMPLQAPMAVVASTPSTASPSSPAATTAPSADALSRRKARADEPAREQRPSASNGASAAGGMAVGVRSMARAEAAADASVSVPAPAPPARMIADTTARVLSGRITTTSGAPVIGVQLSVAGIDKTSTETDSTGAYRLRVAGDSVVLLARRLGFLSTRQVVDLRSRDSARVDMKMKADINQLSAVVVTGDFSSVEAKRSLGVELYTAAPVACWSLRASSTSAFQLPSHLQVPVLPTAGSVHVQWINWPVKGRITDVEMSADRTGTLRGSSTASGDSLAITLTRRGDDWAGTASGRRDANRVEQPIIMVSAAGTLCKL